MQELVATGKMNQDQTFFTMLANVTMEGKLEPLYETVRAAFRLGLVNKDLMGISYFEESLLKPIDQVISKRELMPITSASDELALWGNYSNDKPIPVKIERNTLFHAAAATNSKNAVSANCKLTFHDILLHTFSIVLFAINPTKLIRRIKHCP